MFDIAQRETICQWKFMVNWFCRNPRVADKLDRLEELEKRMAELTRKYVETVNLVNTLCSLGKTP
jgi:hypothetical protein